MTSTSILRRSFNWNNVATWWMIAALASTVVAQDQVTTSLDSRLQLIRAGHFVMGEQRTFDVFRKDQQYMDAAKGQEHPHLVRLTKPFYLATTELTVAQFQEFVAATGYETTAERGDNEALMFKPVQPYDRVDSKQPFNRDPAATWKNPGFEQQDDHPVVCVSWHDAQEFCRWLSEKEGLRYRLPTEAEWEYASRAGRRTMFSWGDDYRGVIHERANIGNVELEQAHENLVLRKWAIDVDNDPGDGHIFTSPVGTFPANDWGLHDSIGNVWEWCEDTYVETFYKNFDPPRGQSLRKTAVDPVSTEPWNEYGDWRVIRGGSWYSSPVMARTDIRGFFDAPDASCYIGFRIARDAPQNLIDEAQADWQREQQAIETILGDVERFETNDRIHPTLVYHRAAPPEVIEAIKHVSGFRRFQGHRPSGDTFMHLSQASGLKEIVFHDLRDLKDADFAHLTRLPSLEVLQFSGPSQLTDACLEHIGKLTTLKSLHIAGDEITDEGLVRLRDLQQLEELAIRSPQTNGAILSALGEVPLRSLRIGDLADEHCEALGKMTNLESMSCGGESLTEAGFAHFANLTQLTSLAINGCGNISASGFAPLEKLTRLQMLTMRDTQASDEVVKLLNRNHHRLYVIDLNGDVLTDDGFRAACEIISLHNLHVDGNDCQLTDAAFDSFWRLKRVYSLRFASQQVTGSGFATLSEADRLNSINLYCPKLTDVGLEHISAVRELKNLTLRAEANITEDGFLFLADAPKLQRIQLQGRFPQISDEAIAKLKELKPDVSVEVQR